MAGPRPSRHYVMRPRQWGSGSSLMDDLPPLPMPVYHGGRLVRWAAGRPRRVGLTVAWLVAVWLTGSVGWGTLLFVAVLAVGLTLWVRSRRSDGVAASRADLLAEVRARRRLEKQWPLACDRAGLRSRRDGKAPRLRQVKALGSESYRATLRCGDVGVPVEDVQKAASAIADIVGCRELDVARSGPGVATLTFHWRDPVGRVLPLTDLPVASKGRAAYGIRADGSAASIAYNLSVLFGGETGSGKSNIGWVVLADLLRQGIPLRLYVSDVKGTELAAFAERVGVPVGTFDVRQYSSTVDSTVKMLDSGVGAMEKRKEAMAAEHSRKWRPSARDPLVVFWLDELVPLQAMLKKGADSSFARIAYTGRALGYVLWVNAQVGHDDVLGVARNFIPQRLCLSTTTPAVTDTILGTGAASRGARCHELVIPRDAGIGYSVSDEEQGSRIERFRAALVTDAQTEFLARGELPPEMPPLDKAGAETTALYRWFYRDDPPGVAPQYVGISNDALRRLEEHHVDAREFTQAPGGVRVEIEHYPTRQAALDAEKRAIVEEKPRWNIIHNEGNPNRRIPRRRRAGAA